MEAYVEHLTLVMALLTSSANGRSKPAGEVIPLGFPGDDEALVRALQTGDGRAAGALFDRYGPHLRRVLAHLVGVDPELPDLLQDALLAAISSIGGLRQPRLLKAWLTRIAVFTARGWIRRKKASRFLRFFDPAAVPDIPTDGVDPALQQSVRSVYAVLDQLSVAQRTAFALRYIDGMEITEVAEVCGVSTSTIKRRLASAEHRFQSLATKHPALEPWMKGGVRWSTP